MEYTCSPDTLSEKNKGATSISSYMHKNEMLDFCDQYTAQSMDPINSWTTTLSSF